MFTEEDLQAAGFEFVGRMDCEEHANGTTYGLKRTEDVGLVQLVIPCSTSRQEAIDKAIDMLTFPGGPDAWYLDQWQRRTHMGGCR